VRHMSGNVMNVSAHAVAGIREIEQDRPIDMGVAEQMLPVERTLSTKGRGWDGTPSCPSASPV